MANTPLPSDITVTVRTALAVDRGDGDITAQLIPAEQHGTARVISSQDAVF